MLVEKDDVSGMEPVRRVVMAPSESNAIPSEREKYTSKTRIVRICLR